MQEKLPVIAQEAEKECVPDELGLPEGFYLNELRRAMSGHVLDQASVELPSRA